MQQRRGAIVGAGNSIALAVLEPGVVACRATATSCARPAPTDRRPTSPVVGVSSMSSRGPRRDVRAFTIRTPTGGQLSTSGSASSRTATQFPPGHLGEHQVDGLAGPCVLPTEDGATTRRLSGSRTPRRDAASPSLEVAAASASIAAVSSSLTISLERRLDDAVAVDDEDARLGQQAPLVRAPARSGAGRSRRGPAGAGRRRL